MNGARFGKTSLPENEEPPELPRRIFKNQAGF